MKRWLLNVMLAASVVAAPLLIGCDKTVSEQQKVVQKSDGTTVTDKEKTTQAPDGTTKTTSEHKVDKVSP